MKDKNLPNNYEILSLEELTNIANKMIIELESQNDLKNSIEKYQDLLKLNNIIEKKFHKNFWFCRCNNYFQPLTTILWFPWQ